MRTDNTKIKVAVGMSGGVDSSVAALLLKKAGYDVIGLFMKLWHDPTCSVTRENACCDDRALADARAVAAKLEIPFYVVDAREPFKKMVTDYFIEEYKNLRTPNPCVVCNTKIKFGWLIDYAQKLGCEAVATGHYARIVNDSSKQSMTNIQHSFNDQVSTSNIQMKIENCKLKIGKFHLLKGADDRKDQTYFLYRLNQDQLSKIIFPLGEMTKTQTREIARKNDLPVFEKVESQEICFISDNNYRGFLRRYLSPDYFKSGNIVDKAENIIGRHDGLINYTIGQRKGIDQLKVEGGKLKVPMYVIGFDLKKNELIVGKDKDLLRSEFEVGDLHLIDPSIEICGLKDLSVKIRYGAEPAACTIEKLRTKNYKLKTIVPVRAITPGQSAVIYSSKGVLGGGTII